MTGNTPEDGKQAGSLAVIAEGLTCRPVHVQLFVEVIAAGRNTYEGVECKF